MERARRSTRLTLAALGIVVAAAIAIAVVAIAAARRVGGRSQPGRRRPVDGLCSGQVEVALASAG
jgi:hypothetical protein